MPCFRVIVWHNGVHPYKHTVALLTIRYLAYVLVNEATDHLSDLGGEGWRLSVVHAHAGGKRVEAMTSINTAGGDFRGVSSHGHYSLSEVLVSAGHPLGGCHWLPSDFRGVSSHGHYSLSEVLLSAGHPLGGCHWLPSGFSTGSPIFLVIDLAPPRLKKVFTQANPSGKGTPLSPQLEKVST